MTDTGEKKIGKLRASYLLTVESFEYLRKDKEIFAFVVLSVMWNLLLAAVMAAVMVVAYIYGVPGFPTDARSDSTVGPSFYAVLLVWYLGAAFISTFFQGALSTVVFARIEGGEPTFADGMKSAGALAQKYFAWALLSATVGVVLRVIGDKLGVLGRFVGVIGEVAWALMTFFAVPVLALEQRSIKDSLMRSAEIFKATWGEALIMNFSVGLYFGLLSVGALIVGIGLMALVSSSLLAVALVMLMLIVVVFGLAIVSSALSSIFKVVLYVYASTGKVAESFTPELIIGAMKRKEQKVIG